MSEKYNLQNLSTFQILLVDDEPDALSAMEMTLRSAGCTSIHACLGGKDIFKIMTANEFDLVILDLMMPDISGISILKGINEKYSDLPVIMATGVNSIETAVECMKEGAYDYILKPLERQRFLSAVHHAFNIRSLIKENIALSTRMLAEKLINPEAFNNIITDSEKMFTIFRYIEAIAPSVHPVLITGETGVGKELVAKSIHNISGRIGEFTAINVAGLDDNIFSDTLFGHIKGSFTGAETNRKGLVENATNGTLFLDEIGDLSAQSQVKLLRLIQECEYRPLGSDVTKRSTARIITATCKDIKELKISNSFRKDLFYRLHTHHINIPPLRDRKGDIKTLVKRFAEKAAHELGKTIPSIPNELFELLMTYHFPGNIRELQAMVFDAVSNCNSRILALRNFKETIFGQLSSTNINKISIAESDTDCEKFIKFKDKLPSLKECENILINEALKRTNRNLTNAAGMLGITRQALGQRLKGKKI
ncbi:MAG: hypothetical protein ACD_79C00359G0004 [uncultured bacterium]|nr:MAG: hypothetical protein ACD_79C00359G0004 [uncultured bacterium]